MGPLAGNLTFWISFLICAVGLILPDSDFAVVLHEIMYTTPNLLPAALVGTYKIVIINN